MTERADGVPVRNVDSKGADIGTAANPFHLTDSTTPVTLPNVGPDGAVQRNVDSTGNDIGTATNPFVVTGIATAAGLAQEITDRVNADLLVAAALVDPIIVGVITRDANDAATSAGVVWPDGTVGTYTADTVSTAFPGAVDGYHITYGSPATKTYTQPTVTRDASGAVTTRPALVVT